MEGDDSVLVTPFGEARLALFRGVTNAAQLRELIMTGGFGGALLDGDRVVGKLQVAAAVTKALFRTRGGGEGAHGVGNSDRKAGGSGGGRGKGAAAVAGGGDQRMMKTKGGVASEIVFCMSPNKNVGASLKAFGIGSESTAVVLVVPSNTKDGGDAEWRRSLAAVNGERRPLAELEAAPSAERSAAIRALYGIEDVEVGSGVGGERPLLEAVVNSELSSLAGWLMTEWPRQPSFYPQTRKRNFLPLFFAPWKRERTHQLCSLLYVL